MGCPCRQIRAAFEHLPGGRFLVGLLPALPPKGPPMKLLARVPGQPFTLAHGPHYRAGDDRVVEVDPADVAEMRRLGCTDLPPAEPEPVKAEAPFDPVAQEIMGAEEPAVEATEHTEQ